MLHLADYALIDAGTLAFRTVHGWLVMRAFVLTTLATAAMTHESRLAARVTRLEREMAALTDRVELAIYELELTDGGV